MSRNQENINSTTEQTPSPLMSLITRAPNNADPDVTRSMDRQTTENLGAVVETAEETIKVEPRTGSNSVKSSNSTAEGHMNDVNWTLDRFEKKFTMVGTYNWTTAMAAGTILKKLVLPNDILVTPALKFPFSTTGYWRAENVVLKVNITGSPFYAGKLVLGFFPNFNGVDVSSSPTFMQQLIQMGAGHINVADNQNLEYRVPFRHYLSWIEYPNDILGTAYLMVQNPLKTGPANDNSVTVTIFVSLEGSEFKVPEFIQPSALNCPKFADQDIEVLTIEESAKVFDNKKMPTGNAAKDTYVVASKSQFSLNEHAEKIPKTILCAGPGIMRLPHYANFADYPVDTVELSKRYRLVDTRTITMNSGTVGTRDFTTTLTYNESFPYHGIYALRRGGLNYKIVATVFDPQTEIPPGRVFFYVGFWPEGILSPTFAPEIRTTNVGFHYFDLEHPAEFSTPYVGPTRVQSPNAGTGTIGFNNSLLILEGYNYSNMSLKVQFEVYASLGDDYAYGYFTGTSLSNFPFDSQKAIKYHETAEEAGIVENIARAVENTLPLIEDVTEMFNSLDAHPISYQPYPIKNRKIGYTVANNQIQYLERLGMTTMNGMNISTFEDFGVRKKETDIYDLMKQVYHFDNTVTWTSSSASGSILASKQIGPFPPYNTDIVAPMDFFSKDFNYWSGGITYIFEVISTQMHRGRLAITFHPNLDTPPSDLQLATQQYFTSIDLSEGRSIIAITMPYLQKTAYKRVYSSIFSGVTNIREFINGCFAIRVQNPLRASNNVDSSVDINIYKMAACDFNLQSYGNINYLIGELSLKPKQQEEKKPVKTLIGIQSKAPITAVRTKRQ